MGRERYTAEDQKFYRTYIASAQWRARRADRIRKAGYQCEFRKTLLRPGDVAGVRCLRTTGLCVHHNNYTRLGREFDTDIDVYCWPHHILEHLLWKRCANCREPCLGNADLGEAWLYATLAAEGISVDSSSLVWSKLPNKEYFLEMTPDLCPRCQA